MIIIPPTPLQEALLQYAQIDISACPGLPVSKYQMRKDIIIVTVALGLTTYYMQECRVSIRQQNSAMVKIYPNGFVPIKGIVPLRIVRVIRKCMPVTAGWLGFTVCSTNQSLVSLDFSIMFLDANICIQYVYMSMPRGIRR